LKFVVSQNVFNNKPIPDIIPITTGFSITPPVMVPDTTKAGDPILHARSTF